MPSVQSRYLELMKKVLTDSVHNAALDTSDVSEAEYITDFVGKFKGGRILTLLPMARLDNLQQCIETVLHDAVPGDLMETGVWKGGGTIFMKAILEAHGARERAVWVADSFEGLPEPDAAAHPKEAASFSSKLMKNDLAHFAVSLDEVKENFERFGLLDDRVHFVMGWFKDTLPTCAVKSISVLRLDGDYYESTRDALAHLYPKVSPGGFVIIDDYAEDLWTDCRRATDEFRAQHRIDAPMQKVDVKCYFWRKQA